MLSKAPVISSLIENLNPYLFYPSSIGTYHIRPLPWLIGNAPTLGQAWYIIAFILLNIILTCVGYKLLSPLKHPWGYNKRGEILAYAGYRTGEFAFGLLPLTILFAGRNNILLWLTNWSHSTYLLLHRWIARLFVLHTVLHSIFLWAARVQTGTYKTDKNLPYVRILSIVMVHAHSCSGYGASSELFLHAQCQSLLLSISGDYLMSCSSFPIL